MLLKKSGFLGVFLYSTLTFSAVVQITEELGLHDFDFVQAHHGLLIFSLAGLIDCLISTWEQIKRN